MDNEKYGIELELITNKFKEKMQEVKSAFSSLTDKKVNLNANTAQIEYLKKQIGELTADLQVNAKTKFWNETETLKAQAQLEKLTNQYNSLISKQNEVAISSTKSSQNIVKGLDKMTSKIKRFGLSLLSIRSIWALVSRASSAYLAQNTELSNRLQSVWAGLGALLSPIIEGIVNTLAKAVKYIAIFIKALTGVDLLAKATAKSMGGTTKAAKSLNKALAGFDELQNLDTEAGGGAGAGIGGLGGLEDVEINTEWAEKIQKFGEWINKNKKGILDFFIALGTAVLGIKIANLIKDLGLLGQGFSAFKTLLLGLGIGLIIYGIYDAIKSVNEFVKDPSWENFGRVLQSLAIILGGVTLAMLAFNASNPVGWILLAITAIVAIASAVIQNWDKIKAVLGTIKDWINQHVIQPVANFFSNLWNGILNGLKTAGNFIKDVFNGVVNFFKNAITNVINLFRNIGIKAGEVISGAFKSVVNGVLGAIERILNTPIRAINNLISVINKVPGVNLSRLNTFSLPRLDVGTNYVPEDQLAMLHKGESVIPKKFNSKEYFGGTNDETNSLLQELISRVENIELNPYITVKDIGKASLSYINGKSRQLGESVVR